MTDHSRAVQAIQALFGKWYRGKNESGEWPSDGSIQVTLEQNLPPKEPTISEFPPCMILQPPSDGKKTSWEAGAKAMQDEAKEYVALLLAVMAMDDPRREILQITHNGLGEIKLAYPAESPAPQKEGK